MFDLINIVELRRFRGMIQASFSDAGEFVVQIKLECLTLHGKY